jgi:hypothetical protein
VRGTRSTKPERQQIFEGRPIGSAFLLAGSAEEEYGVAENRERKPSVRGKGSVIYPRLEIGGSVHPHVGRKNVDGLQFNVIAGSSENFQADFVAEN